MKQNKLIWVTIPVLAVIGILALVLFHQPELKKTETVKTNKTNQKTISPGHQSQETSDEKVLFGEISYFIEDCKVKGPDDTEWKQITESLSLYEKDSIKTGKDSEMEISLENGDTVKIYPQTEISLSAMKKNINESVKPSGIMLLIGKIFFKGKPGQSNFQVETQTAVAAVRGTQFTAEYNGLKTIIGVFEGKVAVTGQNKTVLVQSNQGTRIELGKTPEDPFDLPPAPDEVKIKAF